MCKVNFFYYFRCIGVLDSSVSQHKEVIPLVGPLVKESHYHKLFTPSFPELLNLTKEVGLADDCRLFIQRDLS